MRRGGGNRRRGPPSDPMQCLGGTPHVSPSGYDWRGGVHRSGVAIPSGSDIRVPSRVLSAAKQGESGAPERVGSPAGAQEGVHRHAPVARLRESPRGYPKHMFGKRGRTRTVPQRGKAVSSERDIRVPEAKRGRVPCRNEDEYRFPRGTVQNLEWDKRARKRRRLPHGRQRLFR